MGETLAARASVLMWGAALVVGVFALLTQRWSATGHLVVGAMLAVGVVSLINRLRLGDHVPGWLNHVDAMSGIALTSIAILFDGRHFGEFAPLYVFVGLFVAFFMSGRAIVAYGAAVAAAYGAVLWFGPSIPDAHGYWVALVVVVAVTETVVKALVEQMRRLAECDPLTGLPNRRAWDDRLHAELARSAARRERLALAILDLNGFKDINDRDGHLAGDRVLIAVADHWRLMAPPPRALLARLGGDEFGLLLPDARASALKHLSAQLALALPAGVTFSVGAATWDGSEGASSLLGRADRHMYSVKERHRASRSRRGRLAEPGFEGGITPVVAPVR